MRPTALSAQLLVIAALAVSGPHLPLMAQAPAAPAGRGAPPPPPAPGVVPGQAAPAPGVVPGRPAPATAPKPPTAVIRGSVTAALGGAALRAAQISLTGAQPVMPGGVTVAPPNPSRTAATDAQGRFELKEVPSGRYRISAVKSGYVRFEYGQRAWNEPGTQVEIVDGQVVEHIDFALQRGGVIVVNATNAHGEPLAGAQVIAQQYRFANGRRTLTPTSGNETDDLGQTRIYGLSPGDYYVSISPPFTNIGSSSAKTMYAPTFYPGTIRADEAQRVSVAVAQETTVAISLAAARLATLSGRALKADGSPLVSVVPAPTAPGAAAPPAGLVLSLRSSSTGGATVSRTIQTKADGTFSIPDLLPGDYRLEVRPLAAPTAATAQTAQFAQVPVSVGTEDVPGVIVTSQPGARITGQMYFDTPDGAPPKDKTANDLRQFVYASTYEPLSAGSVVMHDDYSFEITGVAITGMIRFFVANTGWNVKEEIVDGKDIVEAPIAWEPGREYKDVRVLVTQKRAEVTGSATDGAGRPIKDFAVVLFPQDRSRWVPRSLSTLAARSDQNGQFRIQRIPGAKYGQYYVVALESLEPGREWDFELLDRLVPVATKITVGETEVKNVTLRVQDVR